MCFVGDQQFGCSIGCLCCDLQCIVCMKADLYAALRSSTNGSEKKCNAAGTECSSSTHHVFINHQALPHGIKDLLHHLDVLFCCVHRRKTGHAFSNPHSGVGHGSD